MSHTVFLDESGDLGYKFTKPYRNGGSSRYLTMAFIVVPDAKHKLLKRVVRAVYKKYGFQPGTEVKGSSLNTEQKEFVAKKLHALIVQHHDIIACSITVKKKHVKEEIRSDENLLYNFMMKISVLNKIHMHPTVTLLRDNRTVKTASEKSLIDYLRTTLAFEMDSTTKLIDCPSDSKGWLALILVDWLNNLIFVHYEDKNSAPFMVLNPVMENNVLFFAPPK